MSGSGALYTAEGNPAETRISYWRFWFWVILLSTNFQYTLAFRIWDSGSIRWLHVFYLLVALIGLVDVAKIRLSPPWIFFAVAFLSNVIAYIRFGFSLADNYRIELIFFSAVFYFVGSVIARRLPYDAMLRDLRVFLVFYIFILGCQAAVWVAEYGLDLYANHNVQESSFIVGGLHAQVLWLAILSAAFLDGGYLVPSLCVLALSLLYSSRSGFVLWALGGIISAFRTLRSRHVKIGRLLFLGAVGAGTAALLITYLASGSDFSLFSRFARFGGANDSSTGRTMVMLGGLALLRENIFGYGIGNVMPRIYAMWSGTGFLREIPNTENLYLQMTLESGIVALGAFLWMVFAALRTFWRTGLYPQLFFLCLLYCISQTMAGGGGNDPMFWLAAGMYFTYVETSRSIHQGQAQTT